MKEGTICEITTIDFLIDKLSKVKQLWESKAPAKEIKDLLLSIKEDYKSNFLLLSSRDKVFFISQYQDVLTFMAQGRKVDYIIPQGLNVDKMTDEEIDNTLRHMKF